MSSKFYDCGAAWEGRRRSTNVYVMADKTLKRQSTKISKTSICATVNGQRALLKSKNTTPKIHCQYFAESFRIENILDAWFRGLMAGFTGF